MSAKWRYIHKSKRYIYAINSGPQRNVRLWKIRNIINRARRQRERALLYTQVRISDYLPNATWNTIRDTFYDALVTGNPDVQYGRVI